MLSGREVSGYGDIEIRGFGGLAKSPTAHFRYLSKLYVALDAGYINEQQFQTSLKSRMTTP